MATTKRSAISSERRVPGAKRPPRAGRAKHHAQRVESILSEGAWCHADTLRDAGPPRLARLEPLRVRGMKKPGGTPEFARDLVETACAISSEELTEARDVGLKALRQPCAKTASTPLRRLCALWTVGVRPRIRPQPPGGVKAATWIAAPLQTSASGRAMCVSAPNPLVLRESASNLATVEIPRGSRRRMTHRTPLYRSSPLPNLNRLR